MIQPLALPAVPDPAPCPGCGCCTARLCAWAMVSRTSCTAQAVPAHQELVRPCPCVSRLVVRDALVPDPEAWVWL